MFNIEFDKTNMKLSAICHINLKEFAFYYLYDVLMYREFPIYFITLITCNSIAFNLY